MATTTNYGWETPDDTDLVKDGAAAIRTLGNSIDTTTKNLNPETTLGDIAYRSATANTNTRLPIGSAGQVLRVNSGGTAPEWATTADQTPLTTKGDLFGFDTADARVPIGTNGQVLIADSAQTLGLKWGVDPTTDVVTTAGDLIYATAADTVTRLGIGTAGQVLKVNSGATAPEWGAAAASFVGCSVYNSAAQTISHATYTAVTFNSENFDTDGFHSTTSNTSRITVPSGKGGYYLLVANTNWVANTSGQRNNKFYKNGSQIYQQDFEIGGSTFYPGYGYSVITEGAVGDYFEFYVYQDTGGNLNFRSERVNFQAYYLGA